MTTLTVDNESDRRLDGMLRMRRGNRLKLEEAVNKGAYVAVKFWAGEISTLDSQIGGIIAPILEEAYCTGGEE